jgi:hypothetical protein
VCVTSPAPNPHLEGSDNIQSAISPNARIDYFAGKLTDEERSFLLTSLVIVGRPAPIQKMFEDKFGKTISRQYLHQLKTDPKYVGTLQKVRDEYERGMTREYMSSKRRRVAAMTEIYEIAMDYKAYKLAKECITAIDDMMENAQKRGNLQIIQFQQTNQYANMPLDEIRKEKVRLLQEFEHVKMINEEKNNDNSTIEVKSVEENQ